MHWEWVISKLPRKSVAQCLTRVIVAASAVLAASGASAEGLNCLWLNPTGGTFQIPDNWLDDVIPDVGDRAIFLEPGGYTVQFVAPVENRYLWVRQGEVTLNLGGLSYHLTAPITDQTPSVLVATDLGATTTLNIHSGSVQADGVFHLKSTGSQIARLRLLSAAEMHAPSLFTSNVGTGHTEVEVAGSDTRLELGSLIIAGTVFVMPTDHLLTISDGATVSAGGVVFAGDVGGAVVTVRGVGTSLSSPGEMLIGSLGDADLTIGEGAMVSCHTATLGEFAFSVGPDTIAGRGHVTVAGAQSTWVVDDLITIGGVEHGFVTTGGSGDVTIVNGGHFSAGEMVIGGSFGTEPGSVQVTGPQSELVVAGLLNVGNTSVGQMLVQNQGQVTCGWGQIGRVITTGAQVTVTGVGSLWTINGDLSVGDGGDGSLIVSLGGRVETENIIVGRAYASPPLPSTQAEVLLTGQGTELVATQSLVVGDAARGTLIIAGSDAYATQCFIGRAPGGEGNVSVVVPSASLIVAADIRLGLSPADEPGGIGSLAVSMGGSVEAGDVHVGPNGSVTADFIGLGTGSSPPGLHASSLRLHPASNVMSPLVDVQLNGTLAGAGMVHGNVSNDGCVAAIGFGSSPIVIDGAYEQSSSGCLTIGISTGKRGIEVGSLQIAGFASLGGCLRLRVTPDAQLVPGMSFDILSAEDGVSGTFATVNGPGQFELIPSTGSVSVFVKSVGATGDLDADGSVDGFDLALLLDGWGPCNDPCGCLADFDQNEFVDGTDLAWLLASWT